MADVEAMFYQVRVSESDCDLLRFLWWPEGNLNQESEEYQMLVHLFGAVSSPSCANFALRRTAEDNKCTFDPEVISTVFNNVYVDVCLKSLPTAEAAINLAKDLSTLLSKGGFRLTKWISNDQEVLQAIPEKERAKEIKDIDLYNKSDTLPTERALGVTLCIETDTFGFKIAVKDRPLTRRGILSIVSSVYDPLGIAAPSVLPAKILLQDLCREGLSWDDEIPLKYCAC
jgi:hypothetical protein